MPGRGQKRGTRLDREVALGLLEDAMGRVEQQQEEEGEPAAIPYPRAGRAAPAAPDPKAGLPADVPVDNSAGPEDESAAEQRGLPAQRSGKSKSTRHGSFG